MTSPTDNFVNLPWRIGATNNTIIFDCDSNFVCEYYTPEQAAFIVRAVNSHEAMKEALKNLLNASERHIFSDECLKERNIARAALALADEVK